MNLKSLKAFFTTTRPGKFAVMAGMAIFSIAVVRSCQPETDSFISKTTEPSVGEQRRDGKQFPQPPRQKESSTKTNTPTEVLPPIHWAGTNGTSAASAVLRLPSRRLLPCRLVNTVDSFSPETPVIGLLTEDVFFFGERIIPKNTEVHARAQAGRFRDRIASQSSWTLIWPSGEEITINGLALDLDHVGEKWGVTDGSYGLRGTLQKADSYEESKLFFATFLSGLTEPFKERAATSFGFQLAPTAQNAALTGVGEVIDTYAKRLLQNLEQESVFIRVPAGKAFYLYTLESIQAPTLMITAE